jgi:DNA-binding transcriptional LysR family regulator
MEEFLSVAEHGSFVAAAQALGLTSSGVGKAVQKLESRLGVRLFTRTTRRVQLTQEGALFRERCQALVRDLDMAEAEVDAQRSTLDGLIRLNAPVAYGRLSIMPWVCDFMHANPGVRVEAQLTDRLINPVEERIDLLIRIGNLEDSGMWARQIDRIRFGVFAAPRYLKAQGLPKKISDLTSHPRLGFLLNSGKPLSFTLKDAQQLQTLEPTPRHFERLRARPRLGLLAHFYCRPSATAQCGACSLACALDLWAASAHDLSAASACASEGESTG